MLVIPVDACIDEMQREGILTASGAERLRGCITPEGLFAAVAGRVSHGRVFYRGAGTHALKGGPGSIERVLFRGNFKVA